MRCKLFCRRSSVFRNERKRYWLDKTFCRASFDEQEVMQGSRAGAFKGGRSSKSTSLKVDALRRVTRGDIK